MTQFLSLRDYELFLYSLRDRFPNILTSTLAVVQRGAHIAIISGEVVFVNDYRLVVYEVLNAGQASLRITSYGYEVWRGEEQLYWYDSQPHPNHPELAATHPHHKHVPPDIKHHRILAPGLSFTPPNLPFLIAELEQLAR